MFRHRPFSINYLGKDTVHYFFVNIGNVNEIIYGTNLYEGFLEPSPIGDSSNINVGVYDIELNRVESFVPVGDEGELTDYEAPIVRTVSLTESGNIYLKIPKIPIGSGPENAGIRPLWFNSRLDYLDSSARFLMWQDQFEVTTTVNEVDFQYFQRNDPLETGLDIIDLPKLNLGQDGHFYIKLAEITIEGDSVTIIPFFQSNVVNSNRFVTAGTNYLRNINVQFFGRADQEGTPIYFEGPYSRPNWIIRPVDQILTSCKGEIESDINRYLQNWDANQFGKADSFEILQLFAVLGLYIDDKIVVKKIFEAANTENLFLELTLENLPFIVPGLNSSNATIEN